MDGEQAIGIIDFDTCHPGPRSWDVAYALYRWSPFTNPNNQDGFGSIEEQIARARLFCQAYDFPKEDRIGMVDLIVERIQVLVNFMLTQAEKGHKTFELNVQNKHHLLYLADIEYIKSHQFHIENGLVG